MAYYYHYKTWEDWKNGMYNMGVISQDKIDLSRKILLDSNLFWETMVKMKNDWPYCFAQNMTNTTINRRAYLGQASCSYAYKIEFNVTIEAWNTLTELQQFEANETATKMIKLYEDELYGKGVFAKEHNGRCHRTYEMDF